MPTINDSSFNTSVAKKHRVEQFHPVLRSGPEVRFYSPRKQALLLSNKLTADSCPGFSTSTGQNCLPSVKRKITVVYVMQNTKKDFDAFIVLKRLLTQLVKCLHVEQHTSWAFIIKHKKSDLL